MESRKCTHCGKIGHIKTRCYEIIGYPEIWNHSRDIREKTCNKPTAAVGVADRAAAGNDGKNSGQGQWVKVNEKKTLHDILRHPDLIISGIPVFYVVSNKSRFYREFRAGKWTPP